MSRPRISSNAGPKETGGRADGGSEEYEAIGAFATDELVHVGGLQVGENYVQCTKPTWIVL